MYHRHTLLYLIYFSDVFALFWKMEIFSVKMLARQL
jgi:hypothetical protein